jgi:aminopeptidase N
VGHVCSLARSAALVLLALAAWPPAAADGQEVGGRGRVTGGPFAPTDGYPRREGIDILHYDIHVELPAEGRTITGRTGILFELTAPALEILALDFGALAVDSVEVNGKPATFRHGDGRLTIDLPRLPQGARAETTVWYRGEPADGLFLQPNLHGRPAVFADNWPDRARHWFPGVDHPSDKASVDFEIEAPTAWEVVANGYLRQVVELGNGRERTRWSMTSEIPTYCMVLGATDFAIGRAGVVNGVEISTWTFPEDSAAGATGFARAAEIAVFYDSLFGPFPYEKLAHVQSSTRFGGMENASAIFYDQKAVAAAGEAIRQPAGGVPAAALGSLSDVVAHETVHQWFGDAVTEADWHHLWLSEGFATYFTAVFFELHGGPLGRGTEELERRMREMAGTVVAYFEQSGEAIHDPTQKDYFKLLNANNYEKGAWVLHMLRREVGDVAFFEGVRDYYASLRDGTAWTADFERAMERAAGTELGWFFEQWVDRPGHPVLAVEHAAEGPDSGRVTLRQVQAGAAFRFPVELELGWRTGTRRERVVMEGREASYVFDTPDPLETVTVDPDGWLLHVPAGPVRSAADR